MTKFMIESSFNQSADISHGINVAPPIHILCSRNCKIETDIFKMFVPPKLWFERDHQDKIKKSFYFPIEMQDMAPEKPKTRT